MQKNSYLDEGWLFRVNLKDGVYQDVNKEVLSQFYINLHNQLKNYLSRKVWKNYYSMYIQERGWVNAQILLTNC